MSRTFRARSLMADAGAALRSLRRQPAHFVLLALIVGLGVGATTAVFSVLKPFMLAPLPFDDPGHLVWIENTGEGESLSDVTSRSGNLRDFRERSRAFEGLTGYDAFFAQSTYSLTGDGARPERLVGVGVAHDFLDVLGVEPRLGRGFTEEEGAWDGPRAVVLSHGFWRRRFASDPGIVGSALTLNGLPSAVVGVLPADFDFGSIFQPGTSIDILVPFSVGAETDRMGNTLFLLGRLRPGVTPEAAQEDLERVIAGLREEQPERWGLGARVAPLQEHVAGPFTTTLLLLAAAAGAVLLIVCVNVANVLLARSPRRAREVAVRKALGATRGRMVRQLLLESLVLSLAGGAVGVALAVGATEFVAGTTGVGIPLLDRVEVDATALFFALIVATTAGMLAGLVPALQVAEGGEAAALGASGRGGSAGRRARRLREGLVVAEMALACSLLVAGGLLLRSFRAVLDVDLGYDPSDAVAWQLNPSADFESHREMAAFYRRVVERVEAVPGVASAGLVDALPLGRNRTWPYDPPGGRAEGEPTIQVFPHMIDPGYLETMRIALVEGRDVSWDDTREAEPVVLVNRSLARHLYPDGSAVGGQLASGGGAQTREIVGVVEDLRHLAPESPSGLQVYFPLAQMWDFSTMDLVVRSTLPPRTLAPAVSTTLAELDPAMPTQEWWTLESTLARSVSPRRFALQVLGAFGIVALVLAGLGVYGVLAQAVAERTREIGIRMALGASAGDVRRSVVLRTLGLAGTGVALGLVLALSGTRLLSSLLYGVPAADPVTMASIAVVLLLVAAAAGLVPALRASRGDGTAVLKGE